MRCSLFLPNSLVPMTLVDLLLPEMWHKWLIALLVGVALFIPSLKLPDFLQPFMTIIYDVVCLVVL